MARSRFHARLALALVSLTVTGTLGAAVGPSQDAGACLALLHHQRNRCRAIGSDLDDYWRSRGSADEAAAEDAVRKRVVEKWASDLAEARAAGAEARKVLAALRLGGASAVVGSLERIWDLETRRCDLVALPRGPRTDFAADLAEIDRKSSTELDALGRNLDLGSLELERSLSPFLPRLQAAGLRAAGELLEHRRSNRPAPPPPDPSGPIRAWHHLYQAEAEPAKAAFARFVAARKANDGSEMIAACRALNATTPALLDFLARDSLPAAEVVAPLRVSYRLLRDLAMHCAAGRMRETDQTYTQFVAALGQAAAALRPHGLAP